MTTKRLTALLLSGAFLAAPLTLADTTPAQAGPCMDCPDRGPLDPPRPRPRPLPVPPPVPTPAPVPVPVPDPSPTPPAVLESLRGVTVRSHMDITDGEDWPFPDEHASSDAVTEHVVGNTPQRVHQTQKKMGGEIRVELDLDARSFPNGDVHVTGQARLYEGTSENTDNLRHTTLVDFTAVSGQLTPTSVQLRAGGDRATIDITVDNHDVIPPDTIRRVSVRLLDVTAHDTEDTTGADEFYLLGGVHAGDQVSQLNTAPIPVNDNDSDYREPVVGRQGITAFSADVPGDYPFGLYLHAFDEDAGTDWAKISLHGDRVRDELIKAAATFKDPRAVQGAAVASVAWEVIDMAGANDKDDDLGTWSHVRPGHPGLVADLGLGTRVYEANFEGSTWFGIADISDWSYTVRYEVTVTPLS